MSARTSPQKFTFVDLFAGIGGFRLGLESVGGRAVFANEWNKFAAKTYSSWFADDYVSVEDLRKLNLQLDIPVHDLLSAGFPCQPFSIAGVSKKNSLGRPHGFSDLEQGNLFFSICDVIAAHRPKIVLLENVKNLMNHDRGKTWQVILESLRYLDYEVRHEVINAAGWVPQNRRRVFIVAFNKDFFSDYDVNDFRFPAGGNRKVTLGSILDKEAPSRKYMLSNDLWRYLREYSASQKAKGNGFGYKIYGPEDVAGTLSARYYKDGSEILIRQEGWRNPRRLTPAEAGRLMGFNRKFAKMCGFSAGFPQVVSDVQAYKQFGNSVCPLVVAEIAKELVRVIERSATESKHKRKS